MYLYLVFNKYAYISLFHIDKVLFFKTIFLILNSFSSRISGDETRYPVGYRI